MKWTRREFVRAGSAAGAAIVAGCRPASSGSPSPSSAGPDALIERVIPSSGVSVPVVGIGGRNYRTEWAEEGLGQYRETLKVFAEMGGRVVDTAPSYGDSETLIGNMLKELGTRDTTFLATKVDREGQAEGLARMERSLEMLQTDHVELMQVHNLRDAATQLGTMREWKQDGKVGHIGVTTSSDRQYEAFEELMRNEDLDFIQIDYSIGNRNAAETLLPLAREREMAVLINMPYGRGRTFARVGEREVPEWAAEFQAASWGQFFLKYILSHPAVTAVIPGTTKPHHAVDNLGAAMGTLPDAAMRARMEEFYDGLPE